MSLVNFYRGSGTPSSMDSNGLYFTQDGRLYDGKTSKLIGESLDKLAIGRSIESVPNYSIVAGTNDKSVVTGLVGSLASAAVNIGIPRSTATCSISYGAGTVVNTMGSNAIGVWNTVGCKGYYWKELTNTAGAETSTFALSAKQPALFSWEAVSSVDWQIGDTICVIDEAHFPLCATITAMGTAEVGSILSGGKKTTITITTTKLPFDGEETITLTTPQNKSICAFYQKTEISAANNKRWLPRNGAVELGWAATAFGVENLSTGSASFVTGWNNWQTSNFGLTAGRENISGYADLTAGLGNKNIGNQSVVAGKSNKNTAINATISGNENTNETNNSIVGGTQNSLLTKATGSHLVVGANNKITGVWNCIVGGSHNDVTASNALVCGTYNDVTALNNLVVGRDNKAEKDNCLVIGHHNKAAQNNCLVIGHDNKAAHYNCLVIGHDNTTSAQSQLILGAWNLPNVSKLFMIGGGTDDSHRSNLFSVDTFGNVEAKGNIRLEGAINQLNLLQKKTFNLTGLLNRNQLPKFVLDVVVPGLVTGIEGGSLLDISWYLGTTHQTDVSGVFTTFPAVVDGDTYYYDISITIYYIPFSSSQLDIL